MDNIKNKEAIYFLYNTVFNAKKIERLPEIVSEDYHNQFNEKGVDGFQKTILGLLRSFPDAQWKVEEIIARDDKVVVKQKFTGTHKHQFLNIKPTNNTVSVDGMATYEFHEGKIIGSQIQTDRLGFLQQLGALPIDEPTTANQGADLNAVYFIDTFFVPKNAKNEFEERMKINRDFIKNRDGFIEDHAYQRTNDNGDFIVVTVAIWKNREAIKRAKDQVQIKYRNEGFNLPEMLKRLGITMNRGVYTKLKA